MHNHPGDRPLYRAMAGPGGCAGLLLFPVLVWAVSALVSMKHPSGVPGAVEAERWKRLAEVKQAEGERVTRPDWVDKGANKVRIPVDAAAKLILSELQTKNAKASAMVVPGRTPPAAQPGESKAPAGSGAPASAVPAPAATSTAPVGGGAPNQTAPAPAQNAPVPPTGAEQKPSPAAQSPAPEGNGKGIGK
jgi:hypothetical protein